MEVKRRTSIKTFNVEEAGIKSEKWILAFYFMDILINNI